MNIFSKKAWEEREINSSFADFMKGVDMNPLLKAWLLGFEKALIGAVVAGTFAYSQNGKFNPWIVGLSFVGCLRLYMAKSPFPTEVVWDGIERRLNDDVVAKTVASAAFNAGLSQSRKTPSSAPDPVPVGAPDPGTPPSGPTAQGPSST